MTEEERRREAVQILELFLDTARVASMIAITVASHGGLLDSLFVNNLLANNFSRFDAVLGRVLLRVDMATMEHVSLGEDFGSVEEFVDKLKDYRQACEEDLAKVKRHYGIVVQ